MIPTGAGEHPLTIDWTIPVVPCPQSPLDPFGKKLSHIRGFCYRNYQLLIAILSSRDLPMPPSLYRISRSDDGLVVDADSIDAVQGIIASGTPGRYAEPDWQHLWTI